MSTMTSPTKAQSANAIQTFAPFIRWVPRVIALAWAAWCVFFATVLVLEISSPDYPFEYAPAWYYLAAAANYLAVVGAVVALRWQLAGGILLVVSAIVDVILGTVFGFALIPTAVPFLIGVLLIGSAVLLGRGRAAAP